MFGGIARRYDLANHTLSCGTDFYWRKCAANIVAGWRPGKIADLATGTGDLALALQKKLPDAEVTGVDFLPEMLERAQSKGVALPKQVGSDPKDLGQVVTDLHQVPGRLRDLLGGGGSQGQTAGSSPLAGMLSSPLAKAALAGIAGALWAQANAYVNLSTLGLDRAATVMIILVLGGYGRLYGSIVGAVAYMVLSHFLSKAYPTAWQLGLGLLLVVIALYARGGILGIADQIKSRFGRSKEQKPS